MKEMKKEVKKKTYIPENLKKTIWREKRHWGYTPTQRSESRTRRRKERNLKEKLNGTI